LVAWVDKRRNRRKKSRAVGLGAFVLLSDRQANDAVIAPLEERQRYRSKRYRTEWI
jgi:hypothetical protein